VPDPSAFQAPARWKQEQDLQDWIANRALELTFTSWDLGSFAQDIGLIGCPFQWNDERRFAIRAELDAAFFLLYGMARDDVDYILGTFSIVKRKDVERYGSFRTKELILEVYDKMSEAIRTGERYQTILDPPPGHGPRHPERDALRGADLG